MALPGYVRRSLSLSKGHPNYSNNMDERNTKPFETEKDWSDLSFTKIYGEQFKAAQAAEAAARSQAEAAHAAEVPAVEAFPAQIAEARAAERQPAETAASEPQESLEDWLMAELGSGRAAAAQKAQAAKAFPAYSADQAAATDVPSPSARPAEYASGVQPSQPAPITGQLPAKGSYGTPQKDGKAARLYEQDILELQQAREDILTGRSARREAERKKQRRGKGIRRFLMVLFTTLLAIVAALVVIVVSIIRGPSPSARSTFVTTVLESGNLKFLATMFLSADEINEIVAQNSMQQMDARVNEDLIAQTEETAGNFDENGVEIVSVAGRSFTASLMIVADPSKVFVGTTYPWGEYGKELNELTEMNGAIGGVNGGLYAADLNKGGKPYGVCVSNGEIQLNDPSGWAGLYMIGLDNKNILRIESIAGWTPSQFKTFVEEQGIRDAVAFQDEASDSNNHFVPLIINGEPRQLAGAGSGANPRTVIGQRADGAILLLVTDGRGSAGHLGATAQDLINVMMEYGAVNAANLDGGSSSSMYYNGEFLRTSVTLYYANSSWKLPTAFLVKAAGAAEGGN